MYTYEELKDFVDHCHRCPLCQTRNHSVMGKGNLHGQILFIAEAPGYNEDRDGIPFTGKSVNCWSSFPVDQKSMDNRLSI